MEDRMIEIIGNNIDNIKYDIEQLTICFYQRKDKEAWDMLDQVLAQLANVMDEISYMKTENVALPIDIGKLNQSLGNALQALQNSDTILFSDILRFEFLVEIMNVRSLCYTR
jgi:hypothetical protein